MFRFYYLPASILLCLPTSIKWELGFSSSDSSSFSSSLNFLRPYQSTLVLTQYALFLFQVMIQIDYKSNISIMLKTSSLFYNNQKRQKVVQQLVVKVFQLNIDRVISFLDNEDLPRLKLMCQGVYYLMITSEIWRGVRIDVVEKKLQELDDYEFVEQEPKIISKEDKNIRIHSLRKKNVNNNKQVRQPSNAKQKKLALSTLNNDLQFRNTEIGFKRLLKTNATNRKVPEMKISSQTHLLELMEIPSQFVVKDLLINVKDPWGTNIQRANNMIYIVKKWNQFQHKLFNLFKEPQKQFSMLIKKCTKIDSNITQYINLFKSEPYSSLLIQLEGSFKNLLIQDQLNKCGRIFMTNHKQIQIINLNFELFISKTHQIYVKQIKIMGRLDQQQEGTNFLELLDSLQQSIDFYSEINNKCPDLLNLIARSLLQIYENILEDLFEKQFQLNNQVKRISEIHFGDISNKCDIFQSFFQGLQVFIGKVLKLIQSKSEEQMTLNLCITKFKNLRVLSGNLWNISKYFNKIQKQLEAKQKKKSQAQKAKIIRNFLSYYQSYKPPYQLLNHKSVTKLEKQLNELKVKINNLKNQISTQ